MEMFFHILVPIGICVVLPIWIVSIIFRTAKNKDDKQAEIILKAIENNPSLNVDEFVGVFSKQRNSPQQVLQSRLLRGCIFTFLGIAAVIVAVVLRIPAVAQILNPDDISISGLLVCLLIFGCGFLAIGLAYLVVYYLSRKSENGND